MNLLTHGLAVGISTFVITFFVLYLDGPFDILYKMKYWATDCFTVANVEEYIFKRPFLNGLYNCFYCMSTWICLLISILYFASVVDVRSILIILVFIIGLGVSAILNMVLVEK